VSLCMGAIRWGTWGASPPTFSDSGDTICHVPHILLFRFCNILVSHQAVPPTFYNKIALMSVCTVMWISPPHFLSVSLWLFLFLILTGIKNIVICFSIGTTFSVNVTSTRIDNLYDICRCKPSRRAPNLK